MFEDVSQGVLLGERKHFLKLFLTGLPIPTKGKDRPCRMMSGAQTEGMRRVLGQRDSFIRQRQGSIRIAKHPQTEAMLSAR